MSELRAQQILRPLFAWRQDRDAQKRLQARATTEQAFRLVRMLRAGRDMCSPAVSLASEKIGKTSLFTLYRHARLTRPVAVFQMPAPGKGFTTPGDFRTASAGP